MAKIERAFEMAIKRFPEFTQFYFKSALIERIIREIPGCTLDRQNLGSTLSAAVVSPESKDLSYLTYDLPMWSPPQTWFRGVSGWTAYFQSLTQVIDETLTVPSLRLLFLKGLSDGIFIKQRMPFSAKMMKETRAAFSERVGKFIDTWSYNPTKVYKLTLDVEVEEG